MMKKTKRWLSMLLALVMLAFCISGCAKSGPDDADQPSPDSSPSPSVGVELGDHQTGKNDNEPEGIQAGTVLNCAIESEFVNHLPYVDTPITHFGSLIYDNLFRPVNGDYSEIEGELAESWTWAEDGMSIVIQLHDNVKFSNGTPLTAESVRRCYAYTAQYQAAYFANIASIEATGEYELTFTFNAPYADFMNRFATPFMGICDPDMLDQYGPEANEAAIGSGPYKITNYVSSEIFTVEAREDYWDPDHSGHIETINFHYIQEDSTKMVSLLNGDMDYYVCESYENFRTVCDTEGFEGLYTLATPWVFWYNIDKNPALKDVRVRKALTLLVDWEEINYMLYDGTGEVLHCPWPAGSDIAVDTGAIVYDPDEALRLFEEAGVKPEDIVLSTVDNAVTAEISVAIQAMWGEYGITLNINQYDNQASRSMLMQGDWEIGANHGGFTPATPMFGVGNMLSETARFRMLYTDSNLEYPELQQDVWKLYAEANTAATKEEQTAKLQEITKLVTDNYCFFGGLVSPKWLCVSDKLCNVVVDNGWYDLQYDLVWMAE